jgi:hypothetical protein
LPPPRAIEKWRCVQTVRAIDADFRVKQIKQATLL